MYGRRAPSFVDVAVAAAAALGRRLRRLRRRASPPSWLVGALRRLRALALATLLASGYMKAAENQDFISQVGTRLGTRLARSRPLSVLTRCLLDARRAPPTMPPASSARTACTTPSPGPL